MNYNLKRNSNNIKKFGAGFLALLMILVSMSTIMFFVASISADAPNTSIWTTDVDGNPQDNFSPGDIVYIHGTGFTIGDNVEISITRPDGSVDVAPGGRFPESLPVVDENTNFSYEYDLDGILGIYSIYASDGTNYAETTFTDAMYTVESYSDNTYSTIKNFFNTGETVYGKGVKEGTAYYLKLQYYDPNGSLIKECTSSVKVNTITCDYTLPSDAPIGEWDIRFYVSASLTVWLLKDTDHFYVGIEYVDNPDLSATCGIDMVLILDSSASISSTELTQMKNAFKSFVDVLLPLTPTYMAVVDFDTKAILRQNYTNNKNLIKAAINACTSGGFTNWQDALVKAHDTFPYRPRPNKPTLYIFSSDGNPNRWGPIGNMPNNYKRAIIEAINESNIVKDDGVRIITLGIGVGTELDDGRLKAISSDDAYYDVAGFANLSETLYDLISELCGGTIFVKKLIDGQNASNWYFTAQVTTEGATVVPPSGYTDANGDIVFDVQFNPGVTTANVNIIETVQPGYMLKNVTAIDCGGDEIGTPISNGITIPVSKLCYINAVFNNTEIPPPVTTKEYGSPKCVKGDKQYITSHTPIYLNATSVNNCFTIHYRIWFNNQWSALQDGAPNTNVTFTLDELGAPWNNDCEHKIEYYANCGNKSEITHSQTFWVDNTGPPAVHKDIGQPQYNFDGKNFITTSTKIWLNASDPDAGCSDAPVKAIHYIITRDTNGDGIVDTEVANVIVNGNKTSFTFANGCKHELKYWAIDCLDNAGEQTTQYHYVDIECPPAGVTEFIGPHVIVNSIDYITHDTIKRITVSDAGCNVGGAGVAKIEWSVKDKNNVTIKSGTVRDGFNDGYSDSKIVVTGDNNPNPGVVSIDISIKEDCVHYITHKGIDYLGNQCSEIKQEVRVDSKPPIVTKEVGKPSCKDGDNYCVSNKTRIWINATDDKTNSPCNVSSVHLKVGIFYNGVWNNTWYNITSGTKSVSFNFEEAGVGGDCIHYVTYYAEDDLGNFIAEDNETFYVSSLSPIIKKEVGTPNCTGCSGDSICVKEYTDYHIR